MINEEIRDREVRVVDQNGAQLGVMPTRQALELAEERQLDLVKIAPTARPPVCKLMDYGKYKFEQSKKEREIRKNQKVITIKEVRLSATIEEHDVDVLVWKNADGQEVKFSQYNRDYLGRFESGEYCLEITWQDSLYLMEGEELSLTWTSP